jgi:hypothetical protein
MSLWDSISIGAKKAGDQAAIQAKKGKLRADIVLLNREIEGRKKSFGIAMYDHVSPLSQSQDFYAASDQLTSILRPPLIKAQKEIQALAAKKVKLKEALAQAEANRHASFPKPAETVGQKFVNFGKASYLHGGETKIKAELALVDRQIKSYKQTFGIELYALLSDAEDNKGYLPTDRQVRNIYDTCRGDIQRIESKRKLKDDELVALGGTSALAAEANAKSNAMLDSSFQPPTDPMNTAGSGTGGFANNTPTFPTGGFSDNPNPNNNDDSDDLLFL